MDTEIEQQEEMILIPRTHTPQMLEAAKDEAMAEDAKVVWREMINEYERSQQLKDAQV